MLASNPSSNRLYMVAQRALHGPLPGNPGPFYPTLSRSNQNIEVDRLDACVTASAAGVGRQRDEGPTGGDGRGPWRGESDHRDEGPNVSIEEGIVLPGSG